MMIDKLERIIYLIRKLDNNFYIDKKDYIKKFNISLRTFFRDINVLKLLGENIIYENDFYKKRKLK